MSETGAAPDRGEIEDVLRLVVDEARSYFAGLDERPTRTPRAREAARSFRGPLPEHGEGACQALRELIDRGLDATITSAGPRCYHLVIGGSTPAALGGDLLTTVLDQISYAWVVSPLAVELERISIAWMGELFDLPHRHGLMTSGATMANYTCLAAARQWWGEKHGVDVAQVGMAGLPTVPVLTSGHVHASAVKTLAMLGIGRGAAQRFARDGRGRIDLEAMERALVALDGAPAILIGNAGEVAFGDFDPIDALADLAARYGAWLHVDGAFGLFARVSPKTAHLAAGVERADSVTVDGHKWLNVPYDAGFALLRDPGLLARAFVYDAAYLPDPNDEEIVYGSIGPESSRRARSLATWATLRAYGRSGVRAMVERHLELARRLAGLVEAADDLESMAPTELCIVNFRYAPPGVAADELDELNAKLGEALLEDGRYYVGTTRFDGNTTLRPALVNWRIRDEDVDGFVAVVRELGARIAAG